jgi:hypothetical protein
MSWGGARKFLFVQNSVSFTVFLVFPLAHIAALLLSLHPRSETLWFLSVKLNRLTDPVLSSFEAALQLLPVPLWALLLALPALPVWAAIRRHLLMTAALAHLALAACVLSSAAFLQQFILLRQSAHLGSIFDSSSIGWSIGTTIAAGGLLAVLCVATHVIYLASIAREAAYGTSRLTRRP